jgi:flagellar assembly factor FliW
MPIIGTGHGGMKPNFSLMLICIQYFLSIYHSQNHHVKELSIIVFDPDKLVKNYIDEAVGYIKKLISKKVNNTFLLSKLC